MAYQLTSNIKFAVWQTYIGLWSERVMQAFWPLLSILLMSLGISFLLRLDEWSIEFIFVAGCCVFVGLLGAFGIFGFGFHIRHWPKPTPV